jgi:hypothetical protein
MRDLNPITQLGGRQVPIPPGSLADVEACLTVRTSEAAQPDEKDEEGHCRKHDGGLPNGWCASVEEVIDAFNIPRRAGPAQSAQVKSLKRQARDVYAK